MRIPVIRGVIDRRILVNYRVAPDVLAPLLPPRFRPKLHRGYGMVGICLIRLRSRRPKFLPPWLGMSSENAAHRTAVEWDEATFGMACTFVGGIPVRGSTRLAAGGCSPASTPTRSSP